jgi:hypothetical protein
VLDAVEKNLGTQEIAKTFSVSAISKETIIDITNLNKSNNIIL